MVLRASNCGTTTSAEGSAIGLFSAGAGNNTINVTNIDNYTSRVNGDQLRQQPHGQRVIPGEIC